MFSSAPSGCSKHWCKNGCIVSFFRRHNDGTERYDEWPYWKGWNHVVIFHYNISTTQRSHIMKAIIKERTQNMCFDIITYQVKFKNSLHTSYYTCGNTKRVSSYVGGKMSYFISIDALQNVGSYNLGTMFQS